MTEAEIHAIARDLSDRLWDRMPDPPNVGDVFEIAGRVFCAVVGSADVTLPVALDGVRALWMRMYGKPGDRG